MEKCIRLLGLSKRSLCIFAGDPAGRSDMALQPGRIPAPVTELEISPPDIGERITLWEEALRQHPEAMPETFQTEHARLEILAGKFTFHPGQIMSAAAETSRSVQWTGKRQRRRICTAHAGIR